MDSIPRKRATGYAWRQRCHVRKEAVVLIRDARKCRQPPGANLKKFQCPADPGSTVWSGGTPADLTSQLGRDQLPQDDLSGSGHNDTLMSSHQSPCVRNLTDTELEETMSVPFKTSVPCHTHSTERAVKLTTEAAMHSERQNGVGLNRLAFRLQVM